MATGAWVAPTHLSLSVDVIAPLLTCAAGCGRTLFPTAEEKGMYLPGCGHPAH
jgi:trimeric autotransporter adhesin